MKMTDRFDFQKSAEQCMQQKIENYCKNTNAKDVEHAVIYQELKSSGFIRIVPPKEKPPMMQMLTMDSLRNYQSGSSIKPGNIKLNIKNLICEIPSAIEFAVSIAIDLPILKICAALHLWKSLRNAFTIEITKDQAFVIVALWKNCNQYHKIEIDKAYLAVTALYMKYGEPEITTIKYNQILDSLEKMRCIELNEGIIWLREWISNDYIDSV